jgi:hypothetical protein
VTNEFRKQLFAEFLAPLGVVAVVFSAAAFWPLDGASTTSTAAVEVAMPSALASPAVPNEGADTTARTSLSENAKATTRAPRKRDRAVTTIDTPVVDLQGRS